MSDQKYSINFITHGKANLKLPAFRPALPETSAHHLSCLDKEVVPGAAFHADVIWFWPGKKTKKEIIEKPHTHMFDEVIAFFGSNKDDIHDLCGTIEVFIDGEKHTLDKSFMAFIPAGTVHGPVTITRIDRPILHYKAGPGGMYG